MPVDIVNAPALHAVVETVLDTTPDVLRPHLSGLRAALRRVARAHRSVRPARRRRADLTWAHDKFDAGHPLQRFAEREAAALAEDLGDLVALLADVARVEDPGAAEAAAFLRGLPHPQEGSDDLVDAAETLLGRARTLRLLAGRRDLVRAPGEIGTGALVATRCRSLDAVIRLGREARNCLSHVERYWQRFSDGSLDLWALRGAGGPAAVFAVSQGRIEEVFGPRNTVLGPEQVHAVAQLCARAGWVISDGCEGLLPQFAGPIRVGPLRLALGDQVAVYAEWADAVRIDMSRGNEDDEDGDDEEALLAALLDQAPGPHILALAFDPARSCTDAILYGADPRPAVAAFGPARLRRIVANVALGCAVPTMVQHRLMALAA